jgi:hypothetical protein
MNCLIKNLSESESLPQMKNLLEIRLQLSPEEGGRNEVNDAGKKKATAIPLCDIRDLTRKTEV